MLEVLGSSPVIHKKRKKRRQLDRKHCRAMQHVRRIRCPHMPINNKSKKENKIEVLGSSPTLTNMGLNMLEVLGSSPFTPTEVLGSSPRLRSSGPLPPGCIARRKRGGPRVLSLDLHLRVRRPALIPLVPHRFPSSPLSQVNRTVPSRRGWEHD